MSTHLCVEKVHNVKPTLQYYFQFLHISKKANTNFFKLLSLISIYEIAVVEFDVFHLFFSLVLLMYNAIVLNSFRKCNTVGYGNCFLPLKTIHYSLQGLRN